MYISVLKTDAVYSYFNVCVKMYESVFRQHLKYIYILATSCKVTFIFIKMRIKRYYVFLDGFIVFYTSIHQNKKIFTHRILFT